MPELYRNWHRKCGRDAVWIKVAQRLRSPRQDNKNRVKNSLQVTKDDNRSRGVLRRRSHRNFACPHACELLKSDQRIRQRWRRSLQAIEVKVGANRAHTPRTTMGKSHAESRRWRAMLIATGNFLWILKWKSCSLQDWSETEKLQWTPLKILWQRTVPKL